MSDARQSIQAAKALDSDTISRQNLQTAEALLQKAEFALDEGEYSIAKKSALQARQIAMQVQRAQLAARDNHTSTN